MKKKLELGDPESIKIRDDAIKLKIMDNIKNLHLKCPTCGAELYVDCLDDIDLKREEATLITNCGYHDTFIYDYKNEELYE